MLRSKEHPHVYMHLIPITHATKYGETDKFFKCAKCKDLVVVYGGDAQPILMSEAFDAYILKHSTCVGEYDPKEERKFRPKGGAKYMVIEATPTKCEGKDCGKTLPGGRSDHYRHVEGGSNYKDISGVLCDDCLRTLIKGRVKL